MPPVRSAAEVADRIYAREGGKATTEEAAGAVRRVLDRLERATSSMVGEIGFRAMFARCLRRAREAYPFLVEVDAGERGALFDPLILHLGRQDPSVAIAVGAALVGAFFDLLATLIGHDLTLRVFRQAWPEALAGALDPVEKP